MKKRGKKQHTIEAPALLWKRVLAFLIDFIAIQFVIIGPFGKLFKNIFPQGSGQEVREFITQNPEALNVLFTVTIFMTILVLFYFTMLQYKLGQTLGMMLLKIYVKSEKEKPTFFQILVSNITFAPVFHSFFIFWNF